jgi:hypothetical protein
MKKITVCLSGGLGNQLFQAAFGLAKAEIWNIEVEFDASSYANYELHGLELLALPKMKNNFKFHHENKSIFSKTLDRVYAINTINEGKALGYRDFNFNAVVGKKFRGYWQSELYFREIKKLILSNFQPDNRTQNSAKLLWDKSIIKEKGDAVCMHIRRGDYVLDPKANSVHGSLPVDYYERAAKKFRGKNIYVFSDDINWCKNNLPKSWNVLVDQGNTPIETMFFMSMFPNFIIANSTFSWWAAYLSRSTDKKIIAPKHWFADKKVFNPDIIPRDWNVC